MVLLRGQCDANKREISERFLRGFSLYKIQTKLSVFSFIYKRKKRAAESMLKTKRKAGQSIL